MYSHARPITSEDIVRLAQLGTRAMGVDPRVRIYTEEQTNVVDIYVGDATGTIYAWPHDFEHIAYRYATDNRDTRRVVRHDHFGSVMTELLYTYVPTPRESQLMVKMQRDLLRKQEMRRDHLFFEWVQQDSEENGSRGSVARLARATGVDREVARQAVERGRQRRQEWEAERDLSRTGRQPA